MPRQNRVTPFGEVVATPERGTMMGNWGCLHDDTGRVSRAWQVRRRIACVLDFRGRKGVVMTPGRYTELFFLDEATALAAGHRPCAECGRGRFDAFRRAWTARHGPGSPLPTADEIDRKLHAERVAADKSKRTHRADISGLPDGAFVQHPAQAADACLVLGDELLLWTPGGYTERLTRPQRGTVAVLTPASTVAAIRAGYVPDFHPTAFAPV